VQCLIFNISLIVEFLLKKFSMLLVIYLYIVLGGFSAENGPHSGPVLIHVNI